MAKQERGERENKKEKGRVAEVAEANSNVVDKEERMAV